MKKEEIVAMSIRIEKQLYIMVNKEAQKNRRSINAQVLTMIEECLGK